MSDKNQQHFSTKHESMSTYLIGFILSIILTCIPFWMVINSTASHDTILWIIIGTAIAQIIVHLLCFFHNMNISSDNSWNIIAFLFTMLIISIVIFGSLWIMHNLNINMMLD